MALCVKLSGTTYKATGEDISRCGDWVVMTVNDYEKLMTLQDRFLADPYGTQFDPVQAGLIFSFFFGFVVSAWFVSKNAGVILRAMRR